MSGGKSKKRPRRRAPAAGHAGTDCASPPKELKKLDAGKRRFDLVPVEAEAAMADVWDYGAKKYEDRAWEALDIEFSRLYAAARRHLAAWWAGEELDAESGLPHLAHALTNLAMLETYRVRRHGVDDRPHKALPHRLPQRQPETKP